MVREGVAKPQRFAASVRAATTWRGYELRGGTHEAAPVMVSAHCLTIWFFIRACCCRASLVFSMCTRDALFWRGKRPAEERFGVFPRHAERKLHVNSPRIKFDDSMMQSSYGTAVLHTSGQPSRTTVGDLLPQH